MKIHHFQFYEISTSSLPNNRAARGYKNIHIFEKKDNLEKQNPHFCIRYFHCHVENDNFSKSFLRFRSEKSGKNYFSTHKYPQ